MSGFKAEYEASRIQPLVEAERTICVLREVITLGRTLKRRAVDVPAYFDRPTSNGPTEAINGRLEHLRGSAQRCNGMDNSGQNLATSVPK